MCLCARRCSGTHDRSRAASGPKLREAIMSVATMTAAPPVKNLGWRVALAGMGINLAIGVLYSWSTVSKEIPKEWNWSEADRALPYSAACLIFSLIMVPAGRMQDRLGPRLVARIGGGLGWI